jgi:hypothetical protein
MGKITQVDLSEIVAPPRQRNLSFYLVLIIAVLPLWLIVPFSWLFVVYTLRTGVIWSFGWRGRAWFATALCEVNVQFYFGYSILKRYASIHKVDKYLSPSDRLPSASTTTI